MSEEIDQKWVLLGQKFGELMPTNKPKDINGILFLIGVQELGTGSKRYTREQKQDVIELAINKLLSLKELTTYTHTDEDGWPHYRIEKKLEFKELKDQVKFLKELIVTYFEQEGFI